MGKSDTIRVGVSSCLLGKKVRFDSGHKHDRYLTDILGGYFSFVPVCPEVEVGMTVPRPTVRLVGSAESPRMVAPKTGEDWTARMNSFSEQRARQLGKHELSGFVLKRGSPTCGMERVKVYNPGGMPSHKGRGLFAAALIERYPMLPVEEEGRLHDARLRESFIVRVFAYHRVKGLFAGGFRRGDVVAFHAAEKFLLLAHSPEHYKKLGQLVAQVKKHTPAAFRDRYVALYMEAMTVRTTTRKNVNVLQHIMGFLREHLGEAERADIRTVIDDYRRGLVPLVVPLTLLGHYVRRHKVDYITNQIYLSPHPKELMLRNHV
jgi:uncharacterized protein YbgA (DUF1722 family)/uncharacterized protein YbbK (DUF523 family)